MRRLQATPNVVTYGALINACEKGYVRPVRRIGTKIRSGPVGPAVSDRSRTDLGPDRFDDFFRRRENFDDAKRFEKKYGTARSISSKNRQNRSYPQDF